VVHKKVKKAPRSILVCCMRLIGDVILATPMIEILKRAYPDAQIDFLVNKKTGEFLEKDPRVRRVITNDRFDVGSNRHLKEGKSYFGAILGRYDMAIHLNHSDRGSYATLFASTRYRVGFYVPGRGSGYWRRVLFSHPLPHPEPLHRACLCRRVAQALEIPADYLISKVYWDEADAAAVRRLAAERGIGEKYFVIHPFTRGLHKYWRMEYFAAVSDAIAGRYGLTPVWTSSPAPEEVALLNEAAALCRIAPVTVPGALSLNQVACLLKDAKLYVGLDTAITHLAATHGIPMVVLFGATPNVFWFPWNNDLPAEQQELIPNGTQRLGNTIVIQKDWECVPCGKKGCRNDGGESRCLSETTPEEVLAAVEELLT